MNGYDRHFRLRIAADVPAGTYDVGRFGVSNPHLANLLPGLSLLEIARELHRHVDKGGVIDEQPERRPEYVSYGYHFDLRVEIGGRLVYFETILLCEDADDPDDPVIEVVSVH